MITANLTEVKLQVVKIFIDFMANKEAEVSDKGMKCEHTND